MFSITPYFAEREVYHQQANGSMKSSWSPCRVIGVTTVDDEPGYIVEYVQGGITYLETETYIRRREPGSPL